MVLFSSRSSISDNNNIDDSSTASLSTIANDHANNYNDNNGGTMTIQTHELQDMAHHEHQQSNSNSNENNPNTNSNVTSKAFNTALLILCFGFAAYSILSVDDGMTRGWSISEKAMRIPLDNWASYESSLNQQPIFTKTAINVVIYLLGDWLSQTLFVKKNLLEFDAWRTMRNGFIGMVFGPLVHQYYQFSDSILPGKPDIKSIE